MSDNTCPDSYSVNDNNIVKLTVTIGDGHFGTSTVKVNDERKAHGTISGLELGKGSELKGKSLSVVTSITRLSPSDNYSVNYSLTGGLKDLDCTDYGVFNGKDRDTKSRIFTLL